MKKLLKALKIITKTIICFLLSIFFVGSILIEMMTIGFNNETLLLIIFSLIMIPITWAIFFVKSKWYFKILYLLVFFSYLQLPFILPKSKLAWEKDLCYDDGYCKEGLKFKDGVMTKEYCLRKGKKWDDKRKECDMAIESRTCREQGYEWLIKEGRCSHKIIKNW